MTPSTSTGKSPAEMLFQRQPRSIFHKLIPGENKLKLRNTEEKKDTKVTETKSFAEDDPVWVKNFSGKEKWLAGIIVKRVGKVNYHVVVCGENKILHRHVNQLIARVTNLGVSKDDIQSLLRGPCLYAREAHSLLMSVERKMQ